MASRYLWFWRVLDVRLASTRLASKSQGQEPYAYGALEAEVLAKGLAVGFPPSLEDVDDVAMTQRSTGCVDAKELRARRACRGSGSWSLYHD
jgi:hypothetical protein